jgi:GTP-binding protein
MANIVAIVGRPNVGKSTLYNRLIGEKKAIVDNISGVTRDRLYGLCEWNGKTMTVIDTGGFVQSSKDVFESAIREQVRIAIDEARVIIFMVDVTTGITDLDGEIAEILRKTKKPVLLAVNKVDNHQRSMEANEFWSLGFEQTFFLSSITGSGSGEVLDAVTEYLEDDVTEPSELPAIAVVGQPNVGKSSFVNALLGEDRNIVTDIAGTTRDSIHSVYTKFGKQFTLIDTAGIRKKASVKENLEFYSVLRAIHAVEEADVCIIMLDAVLGIESQDLSILGLAQKRKKGVVIVVNKWDLVKDKETNSARDYEKKLKERLAPFDDVPVIFTSVLEKQRIYQAMEMALEVYENRKRKVKISELNEVMMKAIEEHPPSSYRGAFIKIKFVTQLPVAYPAIVFFCNHPLHIKANYKQYLENQLRKNFKFTGSPVSLYFRQK